MKALQFQRYGKHPGIGLANVAAPTLAPDELLVQVHAASVNPIDNMIPTGMFKAVLHFALPATLGSDVAGIVLEVGSAVTRFKPGDAVFASVFDLGRGTLAECVAVPERLAAFKPASLDFVQAAAVPMVGLTAWQALHERARVGPGRKVFIPAGAGGIGTFAIQLAKHLGATVGTTTSTRNVALVTELGAADVVDYTLHDFGTVLRDYDVVLGTLRGGTVDQAVDILKPGGRIVSLVGPLDAAFARARRLNVVFRLLFALMSRGIRARARKRGATYEFLFVRPDGGQLADLGALIDAGRIRPVIDRVFPFDQAQEALAYLAAGRARGKVVVRMRHDSMPGNEKGQPEG